MYFEFEIANSNDAGSQFANNSKSTTLNDGKQTLSSPLDRSSSSPTSPLATRKNLFGSSLSSSLSSNLSLSSNQSSSTPVKSQFMSPMTLPSSSPISPTQRFRRYSIHSSPITLDTLNDNSNVTVCDLALITKKKLLQINGSCSKALDEEVVDPDVKLNQSFGKNSNKDLRREVLLASIQRSLSVSSDDLSLSPSSSKVTELSKSGGADDLFKNEKSNTEFEEDLPMEIANGNAKGLPTCAISAVDEIMSDSSSELKKSPISRAIRARRNLNASCYTPMENQNYMSSQTTFTSTTSMAGNRNGINHCRSYIKKLNVNALNLIGNGIGNNGNSNYYYSSNSSSAKLGMMTTSSSLTPLKKRLHSSSPSKYSSPYHTISNSVCKDFNLIFANASQPLSPDWDMTFKRLKVMHCDGDPNCAETSASETGQIEQVDHSQLMNANLSFAQPFAQNSTGGQPEHELNELAQDFHRLKTPFT